MISTQNATLQDPWSDFQQHHTCSITETVDRVDVAKKHKRTSRLKSKMCQWKSGDNKGVEKLCGVCVRTVTIDLIGADDHSLLSWKPVKDHLVDLINGIIFGGEDGALEEEGIRFVALVDVWVNGVNQTLDVILRETHLWKQLDGLFWSEVGSRTNFKKPFCECLAFWGAIQAHVLGEMTDLDIPPQL